MQRLGFPNPLPPVNGLHPAFKNRFSGWHLGMGLPGTITGLLRGLTQLGSETPACRDTALGMGLWGMQAYPLAPDMADWTVRLAHQGLKLSPALTALATRLAAILPLGESDTEVLDTWYALARQDDISLTLRFLTAVLGDPARGLVWLGHCWQDLLFLGRPELPKAALDMFPWDDATQPLKQRMEAELAFHSLSPEDALPLMEALCPETWGLWRAYAGAELLIRMGRTGQAKGALAQLWKAIPWHVNLTLKLHDLFNKVSSADESATENVAILVYSWNKADLLADTLNSLADSDIGHAKIFALNNGSTDHTAQVLEEASTRFEPGRFHIETLPVNIGAPAARNWLLALPEVQACKWAAFLDDDIVLPQNWLLHLLGAAKGHANIGAVGCRITAATPPYGLQSADYNLFPTPPAPIEPGIIPNRVLVFDNCAGSADSGLFTYTRPCLSVSGCCHMISMDAIRKAGGFDLRYTPSQFDDLDRDLRSALHDMPAVYTGSLAIRHVQHSSLAKAQTQAQVGHVMGNKYKLDTKYSDEELATLAKTNRARLWDDLETKHAFLLDRLGHGA